MVRAGWTSGKVLAVLLVTSLQLVSAEFCQSQSAGWQCACGCCDDYNYCCVSCSSYWYAWLLMALFFLVCMCACLGCGSYGYRRYRRTPYPSSYSVAPGYGSAPNTGYHGYKQPTSQPANYQPASGATGYQGYRHVPSATDYQGQQGYKAFEAPPSSQVPPPYNPSQAPPPYSAH